MGWQRVHIFRGFLVVGRLDFALTDKDTGRPVPSDYNYRGDAMVDGCHIGITRGPFDTAPISLSVGAATESSLLYDAGWLHAEKQKRCRWPNGKPERYVEGWQDAWRERDPEALRGFITDHDTGRVVRETSLRAKRRRGV